MRLPTSFLSLALRSSPRVALVELDRLVVLAQLLVAGADVEQELGERPGVVGGLELLRASAVLAAGVQPTTPCRTTRGLG
jgi:hypothetical protein